MKRFFIPLAAILAFATGGFQQAGGPPPANVRVATSEMREMARQIESPASVYSRNDAQIASEASGRVVDVAEAGDWVEAGEPVAQLDDRMARLALDEARSRYARTSENAAYQEGELERWTQLVENGTAAANRLREVQLARNLAVQENTEARSAVERARLDLDRTRVLAPFSGRVTERLIEVGEYANPGAQIVRLVDTQRIEARAQVPVSVAPYLREGQTIRVSDGTNDVDAPIRALIPVGDSVTRTFEVRIDLSDSPWLIGSAVRASFPTETPAMVVAVPQDAVVLRNEGSFVWVVSEENTARRVLIRSGAQDGDWIGVTGEIEAGDRVVVRGAENLRDGQSLNILDDTENTASNAVASNAG